MSAPTVTLWEVASGGLIAIPGQPGGVGISQVSSSPLDFGPVEVALWAKPKVFLVQFAGNTANALDLRIFDTDSNVDSPVVTTLAENLFDGYTPGSPTSNTQWNFRVDLKATYVDPSTIGLDPSSSPINSWHELRFGANPLRLDTIAPQPGNDGNSGAGSLLTASVNSDTSKHLTNFFIYMSAKPKSAASPGEHLGWGFQVSFVYPSV